MFTPQGLRRAREQAGLSLASVASETGRTETTVRRWEAGTTTPPRHVLVLLARVTNAPELLEEAS